MKTIILASGSKGNALLIDSDNDFILVDIGLSYRSLVIKLNELDLSVKKINRLLITHEHSDHIKGLKTFIKNNPNVEVIITKQTYDYLTDDIKELILKIKFIAQDDYFKLNNIDVHSYALSHDAIEPVGFVFSNKNKKIVLATDTGYIDEIYFNLLKGADLYILEANHSPELLMNSNRPFYLKQRILGPKGHLTNNEAAWLINHFSRKKLNVKWAVAHISQDCNTILEIERAIVKIIDDPSNIDVIYTSQEESMVILI